jgi:hypothetical protein
MNAFDSSNCQYKYLQTNIFKIILVQDSCLDVKNL